MKKATVFLTSLLIIVAVVGCNKKGQRPADLPDDMTPCVITVTQEGQPVEGATVAFEYETPVKYATSSNASNEKGEAIMVTYGFPGAQQGKAKVVIKKLVTEGGGDSEEYGEAGSIGQDFNTIDPKYGSVDTTDLTIEIGKENVAQTFDVGPAVHIPVK